MDNSQLVGTGVSGTVKAIQVGYGPIVQVSVSTNGGVEWDTATVQNATSSAINESDTSAAVAVFEYHPPLLLGSIDPLSGPAIGGTPVTVSLAPARVVDDNAGSQNSTLTAWQFAFDATRDNATVKCFFNGTVVPASVLSNSSVECVTPTTVPTGGISFVRVSVNGNEAFDGIGDMPNTETLSGGTLRFFYFPREEEMSVFPASGPVTGGTLVEVSGSHIANAAAGLFLSQEAIQANNSDTGSNHSSSPFPLDLPPSSAMCSFGGSSPVAASGLFFQWDGIVDSDGRETGVGRVLCTSPPAPGNLALSTAIEVSLNGGIDFTQHGPQFYYRPEAYVSSVEPAYGPVTGGNPVRVEGGPFRDEGGAQAATTMAGDIMRCRFGDQEVGATVHTTGLVACRAPPMPSVPEQQDIEVSRTFY